LAKGSSLPLPFSLGDALAEKAKALAKGSSLLLAGTGGVLVKELVVVHVVGVLIIVDVDDILNVFDGLIVGIKNCRFFPRGRPKSHVGLVGQCFFPRGRLVAMSLVGHKNCINGVLLKQRLALVCPQYFDYPLPNPVGAVRASASPMERGSPAWPRRQQSGSLLVFAVATVEPVFIAKGTANVGRGVVVVYIVVNHPVGGVWGSVRPFELQPPGRIEEGGQGQMSRR
jgi:hypothetical protein